MKPTDFMNSKIIWSMYGDHYNLQKP